MRNEKISLAEKLAPFGEYWAPRTVAQLNNAPGNEEARVQEGA